MALVVSPVSLWAQTPLSAIDWLSESVQERNVLPLTESEIPPGTEPEVIVVTPLEDLRKDSVGLLPTALTGLPRDFWGDSDSAVITDLIGRQSTQGLPEILSLLYTILLAELDAPRSTAAGDGLLLGRTDKLLELGALDQAQSLLERAGPTESEIFRRWFDVALLTGQEDRACDALTAQPGFAPTLPARAFCLARGGDWNAAALTVATGETLGFISLAEADLLSWFLDPELFAGEPDLPPPARLTPLSFVMREAIAQPRPPGVLPQAFLHADLSRSAGWRSQMEAAERLLRTQAIEPARLFDLYTEKKAAASGGLWDRVRAIHDFDVALLSGDTVALQTTLPAAFNAMAAVSLEVAFARHYGDRLVNIEFSGPAADTAFRVALLSDGFEQHAKRFAVNREEDLFLQGLTGGRVDTVAPPGTLGIAIRDGFSQPLPEGPLLDLLRDNRLGEAILRAMLLLTDAGFADPGDIQVALATLRAVGLEEEARRAAIQLLVLERRG